MIEHRKPFGIYHWDTFDNVTILIDEAESQQEARDKVLKRYGERISSTGADQVDIVDRHGKVLEAFKVG